MRSEDARRGARERARPLTRISRRSRLCPEATNAPLELDFPGNKNLMAEVLKGLVEAAILIQDPGAAVDIRGGRTRIRGRERHPHMKVPRNRTRGRANGTAVLAHDVPQFGEQEVVKMGDYFRGAHNGWTRSASDLAASRWPRSRSTSA